MKYEITFSPEATDDFKRLDAYHRAEIKDFIEVQLRYEPTKLSKSRIKKLSSLKQPQYRLRIGEFRVYYDVSEMSVAILAIIPKSQSAKWLERVGKKI